ncbi:Glyceraldehyde-3-phosphate dehydrogenase [Camelus dromedarius]|uniref:Glyceraldehyde-3-phosphate dehydrogenase n=1 Tax=Camelus dromedarius TaxID=9838 RepID=A0A5N4DMG9_CAMDR|nr:Glyceraldehyde-3-phosphate dehydrogenase [Camelus dromedarius]
MERFVINGRPVFIFQEQDPTHIKWGDTSAKHVVDFTDNGTKSVNIISALLPMPLSKVIHDDSAMMEGLMTTVYAITATQITDGSSEKFSNMLLMGLTCGLEKAAKYDDIEKVVKQG